MAELLDHHLFAPSIAVFSIQTATRCRPAGTKATGPHEAQFLRRKGP
jgi:hypothetical protein